MRLKCAFVARQFNEPIHQIFTFCVESAAARRAGIRCCNSCEVQHSDQAIRSHDGRELLLLPVAEVQLRGYTHTRAYHLARTHSAAVVLLLLLCMTLLERRGTCYAPAAHVMADWSLGTSAD